MRVAIIGAIKFDSLEFHLKDEFSHQGVDCEIFDYKYLIKEKFGKQLARLIPDYDEILNKKLATRVIGLVLI